MLQSLVFLRLVTLSSRIEINRPINTFKEILNIHFGLLFGGKRVSKQKKQCPLTIR